MVSRSSLKKSAAQPWPGRIHVAPAVVGLLISSPEILPAEQSYLTPKLRKVRPRSKALKSNKNTFMNHSKSPIPVLSEQITHAAVGVIQHENGLVLLGERPVGK